MARLQISHMEGEKGGDMASLRGRVLLGWLAKDQAINFLLNDCDFSPPIDAIAAERLWKPYRERALAIPERPPVLLPKLPLTLSEVAYAKQFMKFMNGRGAPHDIVEVIKVDLSQLAIIQHSVVTEKCEVYSTRIGTERDWMKECLPTAERRSQFRVTPIALQHPLSTGADIDLPHAEFFFSVNKQTGIWSVAETLRHVTAINVAGRTFLKAGYHRSFARVSMAPTATVPSAVVALASNASARITPNPAVSGALTTGTEDLSPLGRRAAILRDFFTDGLFMDVALRKKRYQLQVRSAWVAVDDTT